MWHWEALLASPFSVTFPSLPREEIWWCLCRSSSGTMALESKSLWWSLVIRQGPQHAASLREEGLNLGSHHWVLGGEVGNVLCSTKFLAHKNIFQGYFNYKGRAGSCILVIRTFIGELYLWFLSNKRRIFYHKSGSCLSASSESRSYFWAIFSQHLGPDHLQKGNWICFVCSYITAVLASISCDWLNLTSIRLEASTF